MPSGSSIRALLPVCFQRKHLSDVPDADICLVVLVHRDTALCRPEAFRAMKKRDPFPSLIWLNDLRNPSRWQSPPIPGICSRPRPGEGVQTYRSRRHGTLSTESRCAVRCPLESRAGVAATLRCDGIRGGGCCYANAFFPLRPGADDSGTRFFPAVRLPVRWVHRHTSPRHGSATSELVWQNTPRSCTCSVRIIELDLPEMLTGREHDDSRLCERPLPSRGESSSSPAGIQGVLGLTL